jgi:hypothetical protein
MVERNVRETFELFGQTEMISILPDNFPPALKRMLENPKLIPVAVNVSSDVPRLQLDEK